MIARGAKPRIAAPRNLCFAALLCCFASCEPTTNASDGDAVTIERLCFVPAGSILLSGEYSAALAEPLLVSAFEITRGEWRAQAGPFDPWLAQYMDSWEPGSEELPASFFTQSEAAAFAATQQMRLPTAAEWLYIAAGSAGSPYPWGTSDVLSVSNHLDLGLLVATPVGSFERGRTPNGAYDMLGNVAEWVQQPLDPNTPLEWAMGGSYLRRKVRLFEPRAGLAGIDRIELDREHRAVDVGARLVADPRQWLLTHEAQLAGLPRARERLLAVGERWGRACVPLLEELCATRPQSSSLAWLLEGAR